MSYNLRREFLNVHRRTVEMLIGLAERREWARIDCASPEEVQNKQYLINNLLFSLAKHYPDRAHIRRDVRTKVEWADGRIVLWVGVPPVGMVLRGHQPVPIEAVPVAPADHLVITDEITSESWPRVSLAIVNAKKAPMIQVVVFDHPPDAPGIQFIAERLSPDFEIEATTPRFVLRRVQKPVQSMHDQQKGVANG